MKITESCSCSAKFEIEGPPEQMGSLGNRAAEWRVGHRHEESAGICGELAPGVLFASNRSTPCDLKAGHAGLHHGTFPDGGDCNWSAQS